MYAHKLKMFSFFINTTDIEKKQNYKEMKNGKSIIRCLRKLENNPVKFATSILPTKIIIKNM